MSRGIATTGNADIDNATSLIALALRAANPGQREQHYYDEAMQLRDAIISGAAELAKTSPWIPAVNGAGRYPWFLIRKDEARFEVKDRYHFGPAGRLVRYASCENAQRAADKLNH